MTKRVDRPILRALVFVVVLAGAETALAQMTPRTTGQPMLADAWFPEAAARKDAPGATGGVSLLADPVPPASPPPTLLAQSAARTIAVRYPYFAFGVRAGFIAFLDSETEEVYGALPLVGLDFKVHLFSLPLAIQAAGDWSFGTGELEDDTGTVTDSEADLQLYTARLTVLLEPPPGVLGSASGGFYVTPYLGAGVGLHIVESEIDAETTTGEISESASESVIGYHALAGVDFVFGRIFSVGIEAFWSTAPVDDALDEEIDIGGFGASLTLRLHL